MNLHFTGRGEIVRSYNEIHGLCVGYWLKLSDVRQREIARRYYSLQRTLWTARSQPDQIGDKP